MLVVLCGLGAGCNNDRNPMAPSPGPGNPPATAPAPMPVAQATTVGVSISGQTTVGVGQTSQLTATASYSDGTTRDVTAEATWSGFDAGIVRVNGRGLLRGLAEGQCGVTASLNGMNGVATVTVLPRGSGGVAVGGVARLILSGSRSVPVGTSTTLSLTAEKTDGSTEEVTAVASWFSSDPSVVSVDRGTLMALTAGVATVTAQHGGHVVQDVFTASSADGPSAATISSLAIEAPATMAVDETASVRAVARLSDGSEQDVTAVAAWSSSDPAVATVAGGLLRAGAPGTTMLIASHQGHSAQSPVTVSSDGSDPPTPSVLGLTLVLPATMEVGEVAQGQALTNLSDGSQGDVTGVATWTSSAPSVISVAGGELTAFAPGHSTITTSHQGHTTQRSVTVTPGGPEALSVTAGVELCPVTVGDVIQLSALATLSGGTTEDVTASASWSSSNPLVAPVSTSGVVSALSAGTTTVAAAYQGLTAEATICAQALELVSIEVQGADTISLADLLSGGSLQLSAVATYSDASTADVTGEATWSSDDPLAVVSGGELTGLAGLTSGEVTVTAAIGATEDSKVITVIFP